MTRWATTQDGVQRAATNSAQTADRTAEFEFAFGPGAAQSGNRRKSDQHSYSQRTRFIPDELLPWFEPVTTGRATLEFPQSGGVSDVTTADVRKRIGRMWA